MKTLCCCRCGLKTGLTVIGLNRVIWGLIWAGNSFRLLVPGFMNFDYVERDYSDKTAELFLAMGIMMLISGALCTLLGIFTIFGAKQLSASLLRLSLVLQGLLMVSVAIFVCLGIALIWMTGSPWGLLLLLVLIPYLGMEVYFGLALKSFLDQVVSGDLESLNLGAVHNAPQHQQEIRNLALIQQSHQQQQMAFNSGQAQPGYGQTQPIYGQGPPPSYGQVPPPSYGQVQPTYGQPPNSYR